LLLVIVFTHYYSTCYFCYVHYILVTVSHCLRCYMHSKKSQILVIYTCCVLLHKNRRLANLAILNLQYVSRRTSVVSSHRSRSTAMGQARQLAGSLQEQLQQQRSDATARELHQAGEVRRAGRMRPTELS